MKLILLGTSACHLCETAQELLRPILAHYPEVELEWIDIAEQPQWQEHYAVRIPVLLFAHQQQELGWPFDAAAVVKFLNEFANTLPV